MNATHFTKDQIKRARIVDASGKVQEFDNPALALRCYYAMPRGVRLAFRAAGDATPVYPWDLADKP